MEHYSAFADQYFVNMALRTFLPLPQNREVVLGFFSALQKALPYLERLYVRESGETAIEAEKTDGEYRWVALEQEHLLSGYVQPAEFEDALRHHTAVLKLAPYHLSINHLDVSSLDLTIGFDFFYRGNHHEVVAAALGDAFEGVGLLHPPKRGARLAAFEPDIGFVLDSRGETLCRVSVEPRTSLQAIRTGEYMEEPISVWFSVRRVGPLRPREELVRVFNSLVKQADDLIESYLVPTVLSPLARVIASQGH